MLLMPLCPRFDNALNVVDPESFSVLTRGVRASGKGTGLHKITGHYALSCT